MATPGVAAVRWAGKRVLSPIYVTGSVLGPLEVFSHIISTLLLGLQLACFPGTNLVIVFASCVSLTPILPI